MSLRESDVKKIIEQTLRRAYEEESGIKELKLNEIHVTEAVNCLRKSWYFRKERVEVPIEKVVVLSIGTQMHKLIQKYIDGRKVETEKEVKYRFRDIYVVGRIDLIVDNTIIELKTVSAKVKDVYPHHYAQLNAYLNMLNELYPNQYNDYAFIVYINKRDGKINVFTVWRDIQGWLWTLARAWKLYEHLVRNVPPEPEPSFLCRYCEYQFMCRINGDTYEH